MFNNFKKTLTIMLAFAFMLVFASCQLSEYIDKNTDTNAATGTDTAAGTDTAGVGEDTEFGDLSTDAEDYIPEGIDVTYSMDYMNEDLTVYVTLGEYKEISASVSTYVVDDEYLDEKIGVILEDAAAPAQITGRKTAEGDTICVDYVGTLDGVAFGGGSAENVSINLVENSGYIPGFTDGMYDVMPGETVSYDVTFPEEYSLNPDLAGKKTVFTVTVHYIEGEDVVPELNDDFVKTYYSSAGCETVAQFKAYYKNLLEEERLEAFKEDALGIVWESIVGNATTIELPGRAVDAFYWNTRSKMSAYCAAYGMTYEEYLAYYNKTDAEQRKAAEDYIKEDIVIYSIVKAEGLELTEEEFNAELAAYCEANDLTEEYVIETYTEEQVRSVFQWNKLMDAVYEWSNITEVIE